MGLVRKGLSREVTGGYRTGDGRHVSSIIRVILLTKGFNWTTNWSSKLGKMTEDIKSKKNDRNWAEKQDSEVLEIRIKVDFKKSVRYYRDQKITMTS